jgi:hypothetical protein
MSESSVPLLRRWIDSLVSHVTAAAIIGYESSIWARTPGFFPNSEEIDLLVETFDLPEGKLNRGLTFQRERFLITYHQENTIVAKNSFGALVLCRTEHCLVFGFCEGAVVFDDCFRAIENLAAEIQAAPDPDSW